MNDRWEHTNAPSKNTAVLFELPVQESPTTNNDEKILGSTRSAAT